MSSRYKMTNLTEFTLEHSSPHQSEMRKLICKQLNYTQMKQIFGNVITNILLKSQRKNTLEKLLAYIQKMFIKIYF